MRKLLQEWLYASSLIGLPLIPATTRIREWTGNDAARRHLFIALVLAGILLTPLVARKLRLAAQEMKRTALVRRAPSHLTPDP